MPKWKTVRNRIRYNESHQPNSPLQTAKSATVQMQNDYQNYRHRQSKPAARRLQITMHRRSEKKLLSKIASAKIAPAKMQRKISEPWQNGTATKSRKQ
jgi:hypothetical protein